MTKRLLALLIAILSMVPPSFGWGSKGHEIAGRVAALALPSDMPEFFRKAADRLSYLTPEPDRWYTQSSPALRALNGPDHYFNLEPWGSDSIPATRYELILAFEKKGLIKDPAYAGNVGTAPVAIAEVAGKLVTNLKQWRETSDDTEAARLVRKQIEESIIYNAGVVGHYITDLAQPLHCTAHHNGWAEGYPNPNHYIAMGPGVNLHSRFESNYVDRAISEKDVASRLPEPHRLGPWVPEFEKFIRRNNGFVDQLYQFEKKGAFASGDEPAEAQPFVAQRLADGAGMLRDFWHTAWLISGDEWLNDRVFVYSQPGHTILEVLKETRRVELKDGAVVAIGNRKNGLDNRSWRLYINNQVSTEKIESHKTAANERIDFRFEK